MDNKMNQRILELRETLKASKDGDWDEPSDQQQGLPQPSLGKVSYGTKIIPLPKSFEQVVKNNDFLNLLQTRSSKRKYTEDPITLEELSFLLWSTQGVKQVIGKNQHSHLAYSPFRRCASSF